MRSSAIRTTCTGIAALFALLALAPLKAADSELCLGIASARLAPEHSNQSSRPLPGITLGAGIKLLQRDEFDLRQQILLITRGGRIATVGDLYLHNITLYLGTPLVASFMFEPLHPAALELGFQPAYLIMGINDLGVIQNTQSLDLGLLAGIRLEFSSCSLTLRWKQGLRPVVDDHRQHSIGLVFAIRMARGES